MNPAELTPGTVFSTPFETGCVVETEPDRDGAFDALDSEGVSCRFCVAMVTEVIP